MDQAGDSAAAMKFHSPAFAEVRVAAIPALVMRSYLTIAAGMAAMSFGMAWPALGACLALLPVLGGGLVFAGVRRAEMFRLSVVNAPMVLLDGAWHEAELQPRSFVAPWLLVLRLRTRSGIPAYFCWHAPLGDRNMVRRLRIMLRCLKTK